MVWMIMSLGNNDKKLSEIQLDHERENEFVVVVVKVVREIEDMLLEEMEKFRWWFEQDIDDEGEEEEEDEDGGKCQLEAIGRKVKVTEKEAILENLLPLEGGPVKMIISLLNLKVYNFRDVGVQVLTIMRRVLMDSRDNI
ncbi:hypothetical protein Tco_1040014 [Tanacetum coccineum]